MNIYLKLFLRTALPYGAAMGVIFGLQHGWRAGLIGGVIAGLFFGVFMALILGTMHRRAMRKLKSGEDGGPRQSKTVPLYYGNERERALEKAIAALKAMGARIEQHTPWDVRAVTKGSWKSFGEIVTVSVPRDNETVAVIASVPKLATTIVDYGKGRQNVERIAQAVAAYEVPF